MGNIITRISLALRLLVELDEEYHAVEARLKHSPGLPVANPTAPLWTVPPSPIAKHRPDALPRHADVVIIGSGITGTSVARTLLDHASEREEKGSARNIDRLSVVMLEARDVCSGATGRLVPSYSLVAKDSV